MESALRRATALLLALVACREKKSDAPPSPPPVKAVPVPSVDAAVPAARTSLLTDPARVAVSSVDDADLEANPNHLCDGVPGTTWKTWRGDLENATIEVRLPADDRVEAFRVVSHRVTKIAIWREGKLLREAKLEPNLPTPQQVTINAPGGDFRVVVLDSVPGDVVELSGFDIVGEPGPSRAKSKYPRRAAVRVRSLSAPPWRLPDGTAGLMKPGPWPTLDAYCKQYEKELGDEAKAAEPICSSMPFMKIEGGVTDSAVKFMTVRVRARHGREPALHRLGPHARDHAPRVEPVLWR